MGLIHLKKELRKLDMDSLIDIVADLYKRDKSVKAYFDYYINPDEQAIFKTYQVKVTEAFYSKRGKGPNPRKGKQTINDFRKFGTSAHLQADLMLTYVETGVKYTIEFGDMDEAFYTSLVTMYEDSLGLMRRENLLDKFEARAANIVVNTQGIGWGFQDDLLVTWMAYYPTGTSQKHPVRLKLGNEKLKKAARRRKRG